MATALLIAESSPSLLETVEFWSRESSNSSSFEPTNGEETLIDGALDVVVVKESLDDGVTDLLNRDGLRGAYWCDVFRGGSEVFGAVVELDNSVDTVWLLEGWGV